jgi:hypothetical protein
MADLPRTITAGVRMIVRRVVAANAANRGLSGSVCRIAVFSNNGVIAQSKPASKTSVTPSVNASGFEGRDPACI